MCELRRDMNFHLVYTGELNLFIHLIFRMCFYLQIVALKPNTFMYFKGIVFWGKCVYYLSYREL